MTKNNLGQELSKEQIEYFKNSKVVDKEGNLLVCYHGTPQQGFKEFDARKGDSQFGKYKFKNANVNYFTTNKASAVSYTDIGYENDGNVYACYINIVNPYIVDNTTESEIKTSFNIKDKRLRDKQIDLFDKLIDKYEWKEVDLEELNKDLSVLNLEARVDDEYLTIYKLGNNSLFGTEMPVYYQDIDDELFVDYDDVEDFREEVIGEEDDYYFSTDDIVRYVLSLDEGYDGIIIEDVFDSKSMFSGTGTDVITLRSSNQIKEVSNMKPTDSNRIDEELKQEELQKVIDVINKYSKVKVTTDSIKEVNKEEDGSYYLKFYSLKGNDIQPEIPYEGEDANKYNEMLNELASLGYKKPVRTNWLRVYGPHGHNKAIWWIQLKPKTKELKEFLKPVDSEIEDASDADLLVSDSVYQVKDFLCGHEFFKLCYYPECYYSKKDSKNEDLYVLVDPWQGTHWDCTKALYDNMWIDNRNQPFSRWAFINDKDAIEEYLSEYDKEQIDNFGKIETDCGILIYLDGKDIPDCDLVKVFKGRQLEESLDWNSMEEVDNEEYYKVSTIKDILDIWYGVNSLEEIKLYHGTTKDNWEKIKEEGILKAQELYGPNIKIGKKGIYLTTSEDDAKEYVSRMHEEDAIVLEIEVNKLDFDKLYVDLNEIYRVMIDEDGKEYWDIYDFVYLDDIPLDAVNNNLTESKADLEKFRRWAGDELADRFYKQKDRLEGKEKDIYYWMSGGEAGKQELLMTLRDYEKMPTRKEADQKGKEGAEKIYEDDEWLVYHITSYEGAVKYGKGTRWCISASRDYNGGMLGRDFWDSYSDSEIYFYINKKNDNKYALVYDSEDHWTIYDDADYIEVGNYIDYANDEDSWNPYDASKPHFPDVNGLPDINAEYDRAEREIKALYPKDELEESLNNYDIPVYRVDSRQGEGNDEWKNDTRFFADSLEYYDHSDTRYDKNKAKKYLLNIKDFKVFDPMVEWKDNLDVESWSVIRTTEEFCDEKGLQIADYLDGVDYDDPNEYHEVLIDTDSLAAYGLDNGYDITIIRDIPQYYVNSYGDHDYSDRDRKYTEYAVHNSNAVKLVDAKKFDKCSSKVDEELSPDMSEEEIKALVDKYFTEENLNKVLPQLEAKEGFYGKCFIDAKGKVYDVQKLANAHDSFLMDVFDDCYRTAEGKYPNWDDLEEIEDKYDIGAIIVDAIWDKLYDMNWIQCSNEIGGYIALRGRTITEDQFNAMENWVSNLYEHGGESVEISLYTPTGWKSKRYLLKDNLPEDIIRKIRRASKSGYLPESLKEDYGYHAGDLGKSEYYGNQTGGRNTGHFGTGTYFVGNPEKIKNYNKRDGESAPQHKVDFSKYHLYKPSNNDIAYDLHDTLGLLDGVYTWYLPILKEITNVVSQAEKYIYDGQPIQNLSEFIDDLNKCEAYYDEEPIDKEKALRYLDEEEFDKYLDEIDPDEWGNAWEEKYALEKVFNDKLKRYKNWRISTDVNKINNIVEELYKALEGKHTNEEIQNALDKVVEVSKEYKTRNADKEDSLATVFMKALGYEGVDTRHLNKDENGTAGLDNTSYGSVIYDLKPDTVVECLDEELLSTEEFDMFVAESPYQAKNYLLGQVEAQRIFADETSSTLYLIAPTYETIHSDMTAFARECGYNTKMDDFDNKKACLIFVPDTDEFFDEEGDAFDDDYTYRYIFNGGEFIVYSRYQDFENFDLCKVFGNDYIKEERVDYDSDAYRDGILFEKISPKFNLQSFLKERLENYKVEGNKTITTKISRQ